MRRDELDVRNVAGRVIQDLENGAVGAPVRNPVTGEQVFACERAVEQIRGMSYPLEEAKHVSFLMEAFIEIIERAKVFAVKNEVLPDPAWDTIEHWLRLPAPIMWIDRKGIWAKSEEGTALSLSFLAFDPTRIEDWEGHKFLIGEETERMFFLITFAHSSNPRARRITDHKYFTTLYGQPILFLEKKSGAVIIEPLDFFEPPHTLVWDGDVEALMRESMHEFATALFSINVVSNIEEQKLERAKRLPKSERDLPEMEYHVLRITTDRKRTRTRRSTDGEPTRQSPRQHFRRGHVRRLGDERYTWVRPCVVGDPEQGRIEKDYLL